MHIYVKILFQGSGLDVLNKQQPKDWNRNSKARRLLFIFSTQKSSPVSIVQKQVDYISTLGGTSGWSTYFGTWGSNASVWGTEF